ncbi:hypothetical protein AMECASPLE_039050 [Ameca splendens]|uniref:Uncharacterized protein n=1 Tax=Ameca splendens TaxID=208324 RepID=A0ABV0ZJL7_9TELE
MFRTNPNPSKRYVSRLSGPTTMFYVVVPTFSQSDSVTSSTGIRPRANLTTRADTVFKANKRKCQSNMAEGKVGESGAVNQLTDITESQTSAEDDSSESSAAHCPQDLRSVLVTSVLNLEQLDIDLYRNSLDHLSTFFLLLMTTYDHG